MIDKTTTLDQVAGLVSDGQILGLGGMTIYRRPVGFVKALIRRKQPPRDVTLLSFTGGLASDMLIGAGIVKRTRCCYLGLEAFGFAPMFTTAVSAGTVEVIEESEASIANGLRARMAGTGFMPSTAWIGTDMLAVRPDVQTITDPYSGKLLTAFPAIGCDITVIHALRADRSGNTLLGGNPTIDFELANVSKIVIVTTEEVVESLPAPIDIPGHVVTAVVPLPNGAWPTSCYPLYPIDGEEILRYIAACNAGQFNEYVHR
jgi:glutaconate CoA-transferase, subunit A